jgi:hypothetical protein
MTNKGTFIMKNSIPALGIIGTILFFFSMVGLSQAVTFPDDNKVHGAQHMATKVPKNSKAKKSLRQGTPMNKGNQRHLGGKIQRKNKPRGVVAPIGKRGNGGLNKGGGVSPIPPPPPPGPIGKQ